MRSSAGPPDFPDFAWAVGEEGSDPTVLLEGRLHRHDQFAASGHYDHLEQDVDAVRGLGLRILRYGMPWRLCEVEPNAYDWTLWDRALGACEKAGVEPIVDLCHFGLPDHYPGFLDPRWVEGFVRYVDAFLARYPAPRWFTPVNEPGTTALGSGLLGGWNDRRKTQADWARILANVTLANLEACARVRADRDGWWLGCEGFGIPVAVAAGLEAEVEKRRALGWLVWDLHLGVPPAPEAASALDAVDAGILARIEALATTRNVIAGHDVYPVSPAPVGGPAPAWTVRDRIDLYEGEARRWHERYRVPFWIGETSNLTLPLADQVPWLRELCGALRRLREDGLPARGLCWYSRGDQYDWQTMLLNPSGAVTEVGLFDTQRRARPVAAELSRLAAAGAP